MNEIVKYHNHINDLSFKNFSDYDLNFLMVICAKMKDLGEETQYFEYSKLMELLDWDMSKSIDVFHKDLKRMSEKLRHVGATIDLDPDRFTAFNLFSDFEGDKKKRTLTVRVNPKFKYILNDITKNFTRFELSEYVHLEGKYSKLLYQHLKQYRKSGWWQVSLEDFKRELAIPDSMPTMNITSKVIKPSVELIKACKGFSDLAYEPIKSKRRGSRIEGYKFSWTADKQIPGQLSLDDFSKPTKKPKTKANFEQRNYTKAEMDDIEKQLLKKTKGDMD